MRKYNCETIIGPGDRHCGSPATRRLTCTFAKRRTAHHYFCSRDSRAMREMLADPLWAYMGSTGTTEILISQHLPYVGAFCVGALQQASRRPGLPPADDAGADGGRRQADAPAVDLTPESLPPKHTDHLLAAAMNFVNDCPGLTTPGLDIEAAGRAWWVAHHDPQALDTLDSETRRAIPPELLEHIAVAAHYGSGLFTRVERDAATGRARGIYPDRTGRASAAGSAAPT